ncbi:MAG: 30S ribosomal protein S4 [Oligoflexales bacterium]
MSRDRGPRVKKMRAVGLDLPGLSRKTIERRPFPPGMKEGQFRKKKGEYGLQLQEKQKLRFNYGLTEKSLKRLAEEAFRSREHPGHKLLEFLECRLDSVVFRAGLAPTIPAARQLVRHKHVTVDGKRVNIPSYRMKAGQTIALTEKAQKIPAVVSSAERPSLTCPAWLSADTKASTAKLIALPDHESFPFLIEISRVVEFYSR